MKDAILKKAHAVAVKAIKNSYSPYSKFQVGSAVVTDKGIFGGCNIENASYGATVCAERVAIWTASASRARHIHAVVVVTKQKNLVPPCALCLQVIAEFADSNTMIFLGDLKKIKAKHRFDELLTHPFGPSFLK